MTTMFSLEKVRNMKMDEMNFKTRGVEAALAPLVKQIRKLVNPSSGKRKKKGHSKKAMILVQALQVATDNFVWRGESIATEVPEAKQDVIIAVGDIRARGTAMTVSANEFASDPCSQDKRNNMVICARELLASVARLLIIADMIDVHVLMSAVYCVNNDIEFFRHLRGPPDLMEGMRRFEKSAHQLGVQAGKRQAELKDNEMQYELASARAVLKKTTPLLFTACNVHVRYPEMARSTENKNLVIRDVCRAVTRIGDIAEGKEDLLLNTKHTPSLVERLLELKTCLKENEEWVQSINFLVELFAEIRTRITGLTVIQENNKEKEIQIEELCTELTNLLDRQRRNQLEETGLREKLIQLLDTLNLLLQQLIYYQVCSRFVELGRPINSIITSARKGRVKDTLEKSEALRAQCNSLTSLATMVAELAVQDEEKKLLELAKTQLENLCTQVMNAGNILAEIPKSAAALENSELFKTAWINQMRLLVDAVDEMVPLPPVLDVLETQLIAEVGAACKALQNRRSQDVNQLSRNIYYRTLRVCDLAIGDLQNYEEGEHSIQLREAVETIKRKIFPVFSKRVQETVKALKRGDEIDENEFIDCTRMVYDGVREVRRIVSIYNSEEPVKNAGWEMIKYDQEEEKNILQKEETKEVPSIRDAVNKIPEQEKLEIAKELEIADHVYWVAIWSNPRVRNLLQTSYIGGSQVDGFHEEKAEFDKEVEKWEDSENDIVLLAKQMCRIMMDMTDFIKGKGPIKSTQDIITSAKRISEHGKKLDTLARRIADMCPESSTKNDLLAYLQRIALYCHQLNITSKVKADVHNVSGEFIVSGLDSACSLIQAARNLMNAVVLTVKASYVASRMYRTNQLQSGTPLSPIVIWKMKTPEKLPLVKRELPEEFRARIKRYSRKEQTSPMKALSEFEEDTFSFSATSTESLVSIQSNL